MTSHPNTPRVVKGGLVLVDPTTGAVLRVLPLQYNPDTLTRSLQVKGATSESGDVLDALRIKGPPVETIKLEAEIDATDRLESGDAEVARAGLHADLAALETIVHPPSARLIANDGLAAAGTIEIAPVEGPLIVFVFGPQRVVPVRITEMSITEEAFDVSLNPLRAKLSLGLRVLTVDDLGFASKGGGVFLGYLLAKERLALAARPGELRALGFTGAP
jgi:hypothetical protein